MTTLDYIDRAADLFSALYATHVSVGMLVAVLMAWRGERRQRTGAPRGADQLMDAYITVMLWPIFAWFVWRETKARRRGSVWVEIKTQGETARNGG